MKCFATQIFAQNIELYISLVITLIKDINNKRIHKNIHTQIK